MSSPVEDSTIEKNLETVSFQSSNLKKEGFRKRRYTVCAETLNHLSKRKRKDAYVPPSVFQVGGNKHDPLNLKSINTIETSNQPSPLPTSVNNKGKVDVVIPANIRDPLNLSGSKKVSDTALIVKNNSNPQRFNRRRTLSETELKNSSLPLPEPKEKIKDDSFLFRKCNTKYENPDSRFKKSLDKPPLPKLPQIRRNYKPRDKNHEPTMESKSKPQNQSTIKAQGSTYKLALTNKPSSSIQRNYRLQEKNHERTKPQNQSLPQSQVDCKSSQTSTSKGQKQEKKARFPYGNYNRYYGYRNAKQVLDPRIKLFPDDLFRDKTVLDIGCNVGHITLRIASDYGPKKVVGIDIDPYLIKSAKKNIRHYITEKVVKDECFPTSLPVLFGPLPAVPNKLEPDKFPNNVHFMSANYVLGSDECLTPIQPLYDIILCLSITKWIHLNWGDEGVKRFFKRIFLELNPKGCLILEPQPWPSYRKKSKLTPATLEIYRSIRFKPEHFNEFLLKDVGFTSCELLGIPLHNSKGFERPIYLYKKK